MSIIDKYKLPNFFYNQFIPNTIVCVLGIYLTIDKYTPIHSLISIFILFFYSYFIHFLFHKFPDIINIHMKIHHKKTNTLFEKYINLLIETIVNILFFIIFYFLQKIINFEFVPTILIVFYGLIYVSVHIINYSIYHTTEKHIKHHTSSNSDNLTKNYGPDIVDHLFGTNSDNKFENYNHILQNILVSFLVTYYIFCYK